MDQNRFKILKHKEVIHEKTGARGDIGLVRENEGTGRIQRPSGLQSSLERGNVITDHTVVKVIRKGVDAVDYSVNESGLLVRATDEEKKALNPKDILSKEKSPKGWHIYKFSRK